MRRTRRQLERVQMKLLRRSLIVAGMKTIGLCSRPHTASNQLHIFAICRQLALIGLSVILSHVFEQAHTRAIEADIMSQAPGFPAMLV